MQPAQCYSAGMDEPIIRLGRAVQKLQGGSYSRARHAVEIGHVLINGVLCADPGATVGRDDRITIDVNLKRRVRPVPARTIEILHADDDLVVVVKPPGLVVHPTAEAEDDTVIARIGAAIEKRTGTHRRVFVVHRLDRDTSGVMVVALNHRSTEILQQQFRAHTIDRRYLALARGDLAAPVDVTRAIGRPRPGARRAALAPGGGGRPAKTVFRPVERFGPVTLIEAELGTGRTHQVRVHLSFLDHPVLGDHVYGEPASDPVEVPRLALHAAVLAFVHPTTGERMRFELPLPADLGIVIAMLRRRRRETLPLLPADQATHFSQRRSNRSGRPERHEPVRTHGLIHEGTGPHRPSPSRPPHGKAPPGGKGPEAHLPGRPSHGKVAREVPFEQERRPGRMPHGKAAPGAAIAPERRGERPRSAKGSAADARPPADAAASPRPRRPSRPRPGADEPPPPRTPAPRRPPARRRPRS